VASVNHTYEATAVEFPDGRLVKSVFGSHLGNTVRSDEEAVSFAVSVRLSDLKFVVNELERLNASAESPFVGKLDMSRVALAGHSLGGLTAILGIEEEPRFRAGIVIDGVMPDSLFSTTEKAVLILAAGREQWGEDERRLWGGLRGPRFAVNLRGAEHVTPSDMVWLAKGAIKTGAMDPEKTVAAIRDYIAAFLDTNLRSEPVGPLLTGPSVEYPDAAVTTRSQSLCSATADSSAHSEVHGFEPDDKFANPANVGTQDVGLMHVSDRPHRSCGSPAGNDNHSPTVNPPTTENTK